MIQLMDVPRRPVSHNPAGMYSIGSMAISSNGTANTALKRTERQRSDTSPPVFRLLIPAFFQIMHF